MGKVQGITGLAISPAHWGDRNTGKDRGRVACCHLESIGGFSANGNCIEPVPATRLEVWRLSAKNDKRFCSGQAPASLSSCCWVTAPASRPLSPAIALIVVADFVFTATAVVAQPVTGALLAWNMGFSLGRAGSPRRPRCTSSPARSGSRSCGCKCALVCEAAAGATSCRPNIIVYFAYGSPSVSRPSALS